MADRRRQLYPVAAGAFAVVAIASLIGFVASRLGRTRVEVFVDNMADIEQDVWLDGVRQSTVPPNRENARPPSILTSPGPHVLGVSKGAAPAPTSTVTVNFERGGVWLYNPGKTSCYWGYVRHPNGAGAVSVKDEGPQPVAEVHHFTSVDYWFIPIPQGPSPRLQVSVQRNPECAHLAERGCSETLRAKLIACQSAATTPAAQTACRDEARDTCAFEGRSRGGTR